MKSRLGKRKIMVLLILSNKLQVISLPVFSSGKDLIINKYETHPSIMKIKDRPTCFILNKVNVQYSEKLTRNKGAQGLW